MSRPDTSARSQRSLALAGGGASGIAWMLGLIDGLRRRDVDVAAADLIGAAIPPGALEQAVERQATGRFRRCFGPQARERAAARAGPAGTGGGR